MCAAITTAAIGVASAGYAIYQGEQKKADAKRAMNKHKPQVLRNTAEDIQLSSEGSDLIREESARAATSIVEAARGGGIRSIAGTLPKIQANTNKINREAQVELDNQNTKREYAIANDEKTIRTMQEKRDEDKLRGLGKLYDVGMDQSQNGMRAAASSLVYGANNIDFGNGTGDTSGNSTFHQAFRPTNNNYGITGSGMNFSNYDQIIAQQQAQAQYGYDNTYGL